MSEASSRASAVSTSASNEPECASRGNAKPMSGAAASSLNGSPASPATPTSAMFVSENQRAEVLLTPYARQLTTGGGKPGQGYPTVLISSAADSPAKTSASPADDEDSKANDPASSSSAPESLTLFSHQEDGWSLRMFPDFFPATPAEISPSFSRRWPTSGFTTSPGESWTADTSECPSGAAASSSLRDVLEDDVPRRYFLSPRAAAGILRRAEKRGRELPTHLSAALEAVARTTTTDKPAAS